MVVLATSEEHGLPLYIVQGRPGFTKEKCTGGKTHIYMVPGFWNLTCGADIPARGPRRHEMVHMDTHDI
eukprot:g28664.t1